MESDSSGADIVERGRERRFRLPEWRPSRGAGLLAATAFALPDPPALTQEIDVLSPGQSTWLSATFELQIPCPVPAPVQFTVGYLAQGKAATASLPGFADLGEVPFSGC
jgi:hypothetical protein